MLDPDEAKRILETAEPVCSAVAVSEAVKRVAGEIRARLADANPLVLTVMGGAVVFTGQLLPLLDFPLDFDYIHVSRYDEETRGGAIRWKVSPNPRVEGRVVLVIDDILDHGETMAAIRDRVMGMGAKAFHSAVFADKDLGREKPIHADFVGVAVPNRYVFGFGMDVHGAWRNLPAIYALKQD
jgi:hypoxanthine phosphoribosyltransferase